MADPDLTRARYLAAALRAEVSRLRLADPTDTRFVAAEQQAQALVELFGGVAAEPTPEGWITPPYPNAGAEPTPEGWITPPYPNAGAEPTQDGLITPPYPNAGTEPTEDGPIRPPYPNATDDE